MIKDDRLRMGVKRHTMLTMVAALAMLVCSCEHDEDYRYPSLLTDYVCLATDASGRVERMTQDDGNSFPVRFSDTYERVPSFKADTLYRVVGVYELDPAEQEATAVIYSLGNVVSSVPLPLPKGAEMYQDPVYLQSIWLSGGYLNMVLEVKALNGKHSIGFVDTTPGGMQGKEFSFYHEVVDDVEAYRQKLYGSIPLGPFEECLQPGDTLRFVVNQYEEGISTYEYVM